MEINKERLIENIYSLAKKKDIKIGDLEEKAQVSKGYLSRVSKGAVKANPPVDVLAAIADELEVSVDFLLDYDPNKVTDSEDYIIKFIDKLLRLTNKSELDWILETSTYLNEDSDREVDNPLISVVENYTPEFDKFYKTHQYSSNFNGETYTNVAGNCYHVSLPGSFSVVYLMSVEYGSNTRFGQDKKALELYLYDKNSITPLCSSFYARDGIAGQMRDLYASIENRISRIGLDSHAKNILDNFLR